MGNSITREVRAGMNDNGIQVTQGLKHVEAGMHTLSSAVKDSSHEMAYTTNEIAIAHYQLARIVPELGFWAGSGVIVGAIWLGAGRNHALVSPAIIGTTTYCSVAVYVFSQRNNTVPLNRYSTRAQSVLTQRQHDQSYTTQHTIQLPIIPQYQFQQNKDIVPR